MNLPSPSLLSVLAVIPLLGSCVRQEPAGDLPDADLTKTAGIFSSVPRQPSQQELQSTLLTVGDRTVTYGDLVAESQRIAQAAGIPPDRIQEYKERVVGKARENLVLRNLLLIGAEREGLAVEQKELQQRAAELERSLHGGQSLQDWLAMQNLTPEKFEALLRSELLEQKMRRRLAEKAVPPTAEEARDFYEKNPALFVKAEGIRVENLRIPIPPKADEEARKQLIATAEALRAELLAGATLESLQARLPPGSNHAPVFLERKSTPPAIAPHIFNLAPGGVTDVLIVDGVCHVFRMIAAQPEGKATLEEAKDLILSRLTEQKSVEQIVAYARELQKTVEIRNADGSSAVKEEPKP